MFAGFRMALSPGDLRQDGPRGREPGKVRPLVKGLGATPLMDALPVGRQSGIRSEPPESRICPAGRCRVRRGPFSGESLPYLETGRDETLDHLQAFLVHRLLHQGPFGTPPGFVADVIWREALGGWVKTAAAHYPFAAFSCTPPDELPAGPFFRPRVGKGSVKPCTCGA